MKKLFISILIIVYNPVFLSAYPCTEILFDFSTGPSIEILEYDISIRWKFNTACSRRINQSNVFIIETKDLYDKILMTDTVQGFHATLKPEQLDTTSPLTIFYVRHIDSETSNSIGIVKADQPYFNLPEETIDRLNTFLLNGYMLNALAIIDSLGKSELLEEVSRQFSLLFPKNYPGSSGFFNAYYSQNSDKLITMPYVKGLGALELNLNKKTKKDRSNRKPFNIELLVSPENKVIRLETTTSVNPDFVRELIGNLNFTNTSDENAIVFIQILTSGKRKRYRIMNKRALTNPESSSFQKKFPYRGAIY